MKNLSKVEQEFEIEFGKANSREWFIQAQNIEKLSNFVGVLIYNEIPFYTEIDEGETSIFLKDEDLILFMNMDLFVDGVGFMNFRGD